MRFLCVITLAAATGCASGTITGTITLGENQSGLAVYSSIWSVDSTLSDPNNPNSTLIPSNDGNPPTPIGTAAVGTSTGKNATFTYSFNGLTKGLYFVGAFLDSATDATPNIVALEHTIDSASLLQINPSVKSLQTQTHDLFLGVSAPGTGTIRGTVHMSAAAAALTDTVWAESAGLIDPSAMVIDELQVTSGTSTPFVLFNLPLANTFLFANADANGGLQAGDLMGFPWPNPVPLSSTTVEQDNVDIWLDVQSPSLGAISGDITVNAPVSGATVQVYAQAGSSDETAPVVSLVTIPVSGQSAPMVLPSLGAGDIYLSASIALTVDGQQFVGDSYYPGPPSEGAPITLTTASPNATGIELPLGVGQVSGTVTLQNVPSGNSAAFILASVMTNIADPGMPTMFEPLIIAGEGYSFSGTNPAAFGYDLFGLTDGSYSLELVLAPSTSSDIVGILNSGTVQPCSGTPAIVSIQGGDRQTSDFAINFPCAAQ